MRRVAPETRARLEMQGFIGLSDETIRQVGPWLRLPPLLGAIWTGIGVVTASPAVVWALVPIATLGALLRRHPFEAIYTFGIRRWLGTPGLPRCGQTRRLASVVSALWLAGTGWLFFIGEVTAGRLVGSALAGIAAVHAATGFCVRCFLLRQVEALSALVRRAGSAEARSPEPRP